MARYVLASDFHLDPARSDGIDLFAAFLRDVVPGADGLYVLGDLVESWTGARQLELPGHARVFDLLGEVAATGVDVVLFHGNRDFLLGDVEAARAGGRVVGEELPVELCGQRYLLLHGDSLCTLDVGYQRTKPILRSAPVRWLSRTLPVSAQAWIARRLRSTSRRSTSSKPREVMELVGEEVRRRVAEGYDALICGHVHAPGERDYAEEGGPPAPVYVLGDWRGVGVYAEVDEHGVALRTYPAS